MRGRLRALGAGGGPGPHLPLRGAAPAALLLAARPGHRAADADRVQDRPARLRRPPAAAQRRPGAAARPRLRDRVGQGQQRPPRRLRPDRPDHAAAPSPARTPTRWPGSSPPTRTSSAARAGWTWRTSCSSPPGCSTRTSGSPRRCAASTSGSSSTSSRTSRRCSGRCSSCGSAAATSCAWSATPPRRSTPSPAPTRATCATSAPSSPPPPRSSWSATTARPPRSSTPPTRCWPGPAAAASTCAPQRPSGPTVTYTARPDEVAEAEAVAAQIARLRDGGRSLGEVAILFRINAQSESFEEALSARGVPYVVRGAARFFDRPEVREAVTRLRGAARSGEGADDGLVESVTGILGGMGWTPEAPTGRGQTRDRWESWQALVDQATEFAAHADRGRRRPQRLRRRPRPPRRRAARPGRRRRHPGDLPRRQGPGVGLGLPLRAPGRHPADHLRRHPGGDRGGAPAALRRHDPRPRSTSRCRGRWPATRAAAAPASRRGSSTRCCPTSVARHRRAAAQPQGRQLPRVRPAAVHRRGEEARPLRGLPGVVRRGAVRAAARAGARSAPARRASRPSWCSPTPPCS